MDKFVVTSKNQTLVISLRLDSEIVEQYDELAKATGRSRNDVMVMALKFALDNLVISEEK